MKILLTLPLFVLSFVSSYAQVRLEGNYKLTVDDNLIDAFEYPEFNFMKDGKIIYYNITDNGMSFGSGKYFIEKGKLLILFDSISEEVKDSLKCTFEVEETKQSIDSIEYELIIEDSKKEKLEHSIILLRNSFLNKKYYSDKVGAVKFKFSKKDIPLKIQISYLGLENLYITASDTISKKLNITLRNSPDDFYHLNDMVEFKIKNINNNSFYIKPTQEKQWLYYKKAK
ncbi:MAG: hypothetical protein M3R36_11055 [Bacteroidota bacterium]|nr:hypothetical protein [Bacteroidota bacterium]